MRARRYKMHCCLPEKSKNEKMIENTMKCIFSKKNCWTPDALGRSTHYENYMYCNSPPLDNICWVAFSETAVHQHFGETFNLPWRKIYVNEHRGIRKNATYIEGLTAILVMRRWKLRDSQLHCGELCEEYRPAATPTRWSELRGHYLIALVSTVNINTVEELEG